MAKGEGFIMRTGEKRKGKEGWWVSGVNVLSLEWSKCSCLNDNQLHQFYDVRY